MCDVCLTSDLDYADALQDENGEAEGALSVMGFVNSSLLFNSDLASSTACLFYQSNYV